MGTLSASQFDSGDSSPLMTSEHAIHTPTSGVGVAHPKPFHFSHPGYNADNNSSKGAQTQWAINRNPDDPLAVPLPYDASSGGLSNRNWNATTK